MGQDTVQMIAVGVCNENLAEIVSSHQMHNLFHPIGIQFVKDVIKEQERRGLGTDAVQEIELGQLQGNQEGLVLPLRTLTAYPCVHHATNNPRHGP